MTMIVMSVVSFWYWKGIEQNCRCQRDGDSVVIVAGCLFDEGYVILAYLIRSCIDGADDDVKALRSLVVVDLRLLEVRWWIKAGPILHACCTSSLRNRQIEENEEWTLKSNRYQPGWTTFDDTFYGDSKCRLVQNGNSPAVRSLPYLWVIASNW